MPFLPLVRLILFLLLALFQHVQTYSLAQLACYLPGYECCAQPYINFDTAYFKDSLKSKLFGQHLVSPTILTPLRSHLQNENPHRPLIFFFHGSSGTGKTYTTKLLLNATFSYGTGSRFVQTFYFGTTFPRTIKETEYVESVHFRIWSLARSCERSVFVFDGYDPVWIRVLNALQLDDKTLYNKAVFVFISEIAAKTLDHYVLQEHRNGRTREDLTVKELLAVSKTQLTAETGSLFKVLSWDKIVYVPFLPLTREHLMQCIQWELLKQQKSTSVLSKKIFAAIVSDMDNEFVASGCKRVSEKTLYTLGRYKDEL